MTSALDQFPRQVVGETEYVDLSSLDTSTITPRETEVFSAEATEVWRRAEFIAAGREQISDADRQSQATQAVNLLAEVSAASNEASSLTELEKLERLASRIGHSLSVLANVQIIMPGIEPSILLRPEVLTKTDGKSEVEPSRAAECVSNPNLLREEIEKAEERLRQLKQFADRLDHYRNNMWVTRGHLLKKFALQGSQRGWRVSELLDSGSDNDREADVLFPILGPTWYRNGYEVKYLSQEARLWDEDTPRARFVAEKIAIKGAERWIIDGESILN